MPFPSVIGPLINCPQTNRWHSTNASAKDLIKLRGSQIHTKNTSGNSCQQEGKMAEGMGGWKGQSLLPRVWNLENI